MSVHFQKGRSVKLNIVKESNELAKVLLEPNQKSSDLHKLSWGSRKCEHLRKFYLGADKDSVHRDEIQGNDNKDAMFDSKLKETSIGSEWRET